MSDLLFSWQAALGGFAGATVAFALLALWNWLHRARVLCRTGRHRWLSASDDRRCTRCGRVEVEIEGRWIEYTEYLKHGAETE